MPLLPTVGRRSLRSRSIITFIYVLLTLGAVTTVYPFLVMIGASITSDYDQSEYAIIPAYLTSERALFGKYASDKYGQDLGVICAAYGRQYVKLSGIAPPPEAIDKVGTDRWLKFFSNLPLSCKQAGFSPTKGQYSPSILLFRYRDWLRSRFHGDIDALDKAYTEEDTSFLTVAPPYERGAQRLFSPGSSLKERDWAQFKMSLSSDWFYPILCDPLYQSYLKDEIYSGNIDDLNKKWGTRYRTWSEIDLSETVPAGSEGIDWTNFVRTKAPLRFIVVDPQAENELWRKFLKSRSLVYFPMPAAKDALPRGEQLRAYSEYVRSVSPSAIRLESVENLWRIETKNPNARPPLAQCDWLAVQARPWELRRSFLSRNYKFALDYLLLHGRGILNTILYCSGAVLAALIVNPLCAYALSRFRLPYTQSVLLFLLATMAFPAEVAMIPNFLMLKQLGLLNSFWALILPGAASGFSIFLLKGFFDSLPQELYEAGMIDGASEMTLFRKVTLPLAKPIFAVIALQAFTASYGAFMFAMLVCQAQSHWTLMVWIYEFQALAAPQYVTMAALVIAAIPTLVVFLFTQNVIMRGIILPSMK
jgi:multiple sugar transport system permease protein